MYIMGHLTVGQASYSSVNQHFSDYYNQWIFYAIVDKIYYLKLGF